MSNTDHELLIGLLSGDNARIQQLYDLVLPTVIQWVKTNNGTEEDARDIFQEALIALYKQLGNGPFNLTCTLKSFLRIVCRNLWLTKIRDNKKWQLVTTEPEELSSLADELSQQFEQASRYRLFYRHLDQLGEKCQQILRWFFNAVPLAEIAKRLATSEGYIKKRKFQCKEQLISAIQADQEFIGLQAQ